MSAVHEGREFDAVEMQTVVEVRASESDTYCETINSQQDYEARRDAGELVCVLYSVYGHLVPKEGQGGVECLADCTTIQDARLIGTALAKLWGVPIHDYMVKVEDL